MFPFKRNKKRKPSALYPILKLGSIYLMLFVLLVAVIMLIGEIYRRKADDQLKSQYSVTALPYDATIPSIYTDIKTIGSEADATQSADSTRRTAPHNTPVP